MIPAFDENGEVFGEKRIELSVTSDNDNDYSEQLETVKSYCGDPVSSTGQAHYTVEEINPPKTPLDVLGEQITDLQLAMVELFEQGMNGDVEGD